MICNLFHTPSLAGALLAAGLLLPGAAWAHGDMGEHVEEFHEHIDDYERDVQALSKQIDRVVARAAEGDGADAAAQELAEQWEEVKYHAAVEKVASPLYPAIWQAVVGLREAIQDGAGVEKIRGHARDLRAAFHQGLGALKIKAQSPGQGQDGGQDKHADEGPHATLERIRGHLDSAVDEYADGHADDAKALVREAYFDNFEGLEGDLIEQDPDLVATLEKDFNARLLGLINGGADVAEVRSRVADMKEKLEQAEHLLEEAGDDHGEVF